MTEVQWQIPPAILRILERAPTDRAVVVLLRHSVRDQLPPNHVGYTLPITEAGHQLALKLGALLRGRLRTLQTSPLQRCVQTAQALAEGAGTNITTTPNRLLGDPGVFVLDGQLAWNNWKEFGNKGVVSHLINKNEALPGMACPDEAARFLVQSMLTEAANRPGIHVFVTHDSILTTTAACLLGKQYSLNDWPWYLEGAFFWHTDDGVHTAYRDYETTHSDPLCSLSETNIVEFARREIAATIGLDTGASFFLAGGAFKSLLTGRPPRDLDLWAPSEHDRTLLIEALRTRGARPAGARPFADAFDVSGRIVEIPFATEPTTLAQRLARFDIALSAVGVEHRPNNEWSAIIHPLSLESVRRREVLLLTPLVNWKYALATLERMRRYAIELSYSIGSGEEAVLWQIFESQEPKMREGMIERYQRTGTGGFNIMEEIACRN